MQQLMPAQLPAEQWSPCRAWIAILLIAMLLAVSPGAAPSPAAAAAGPAISLQKQYDQAKANYEQLRNQKKQKNNDPPRTSWEASVGLFRTIYLAEPKEELGISSLFMMGRLYHDMFGRFRNMHDLEEAIAYFQDVVTLSPQSRLADDALYRLGLIYVTDKDDREQAARFFSRILERYPEGDMAELATKQLATLQQGEGTSAAGPGGSQKNNQPVEILPIRYWSSNNYTRVVVKTSAPVRYAEQLLEKTDNQPRRLFIDFANSRLAPEAKFPVAIQDGLLKQARAGQFNADTVRVVLDIESISNYKIFYLQDPSRLVIDVMGTGNGNGKTAAAPAPAVVANNQQKPAEKADKPPEPPAVTPDKSTAPATPAKLPAAVDKSAPPSLARQLGLCVSRIVIDPGHGGKDPGAIAANGVKEKDVVLDIAQKLAERLKKLLGCEVVLTRNSDVFIPLEERTAIANTRKGDLFVSLHINAAPSPDIHGVETYLLDLTNDENAMRLAAFENATSTSKVSDLQKILADLLTNTKKDESARLAGFIQSNMVRGLKLKDLGVKKAPFYVLIGAQMPAVLSEITFLTNPNEAKKLKQDSYLGTIAEQLSAGINAYITKSNMAMLSSPSAAK